MEREALSRGGMGEGERFGMQTKTSVGSAIEGIAHDGDTQPVGMGAVEAQLVSASGCGMEVQAEAGPTTDHLIVRFSGKAIALRDHLPRSVVGVGTEG